MLVGVPLLVAIGLGVQVAVMEGVAMGVGSGSVGVRVGVGVVLVILTKTAVSWVYDGVVITDVTCFVTWMESIAPGGMAGPQADNIMEKNSISQKKQF